MNLEQALPSSEIIPSEEALVENLKPSIETKKLPETREQFEALKSEKITEVLNQKDIFSSEGLQKIQTGITSLGFMNPDAVLGAGKQILAPIESKTQTLISRFTEKLKDLGIAGAVAGSMLSPTAAIPSNVEGSPVEDGKEKRTIVVENANDPAYKAYRDSAMLHQYYKTQLALEGDNSSFFTPNKMDTSPELPGKEARVYEKESDYGGNKKQAEPLWKVGDDLIKNDPDFYWTNSGSSPDLMHTKIKPSGAYEGLALNAKYKEPVIKVEIKKPGEVKNSEEVPIIETPPLIQLNARPNLSLDAMPVRSAEIENNNIPEVPTLLPDVKVTALSDSEKFIPYTGSGYNNPNIPLGYWEKGMGNKETEERDE